MRTLARAAGASRTTPATIFFLASLALFCYVFVVNAWVCDDAYITYRTVDNVVNGHGPNWNPTERVQAYTHPLWMLLLVPGHWLTGDIYWTALGLSFLSCVGALLLLWRAAGAGRDWDPAALVLLLLSSKAFVDYTTSGLETPLSYLLLALFYGPLLLAVKRPEQRGEGQILGLLCIASLAALNRLDTLPLYLPAVVHLLLGRRELSVRRLLRLIGLGLLPLLAWELFSLVYYGFPFPNTAYAKLDTGLPAGVLLRQGLRYFENSLRWDPITLLVCGLSLLVATARRSASFVAAALGLVLYLLYAARIGGDFMSGRFFAAPYLLGVLILVAALRARPLLTLAAGAFVLVALANEAAPVRSGRGYKSLGIDPHGIGDERGHYFKDAGLLFYKPGVFPDSDWMWAGLRFGAEERTVRYRKNTGFFGFAAGPAKTIIDPYALSDPLLARLPMDEGTDWRIGHFARAVPAGYEETLASGENRIEDPDLRVYYEKLRLIVSGPVFSRERLAAIVAMNLGAYGGYRDRYVARRRASRRP